MKLFEMKNWQLTVSEEAWGLLPFKKLLDRDTSDDKVVANAEMLYIWYYCDIKSDYLLLDEKDREKELIKDIQGLPKKWKPDKDVKAAMVFYTKFETVIEKLYKQSLKSATDIGDYLANTKALLAERDVHGKPVYDIAKITASVQKVPKLMQDLKAAFKEVVKEQEDNSNKKKGSKSFNMFEGGLDI